MKKIISNQVKCIWLTGLSGSGKSTIAFKLEKDLKTIGIKTCVLDGDILRTGLNRDLNFTPQDRSENVRRVSEVAKLIADIEILVIVALISPYRRDRDSARMLFAPGEFVEVFVNAPLEKCIERDVKGLYAKAKEGKLKGMTAISSPYENPIHPDLQLYTNLHSLEHCILQIKEYCA